MSYIEQTLMPGETVLSRATIHWAVFIGPALLTFLGVLMLLGGFPLVLIAGLIWFGWSYLVRQSIELAVTNKRVLAKSGVVRRHCVDVQNGKVEGLTYDQGLIGRMLGYGSIVVRGTGIGAVPIPYIAAPEAFKREVNIAINPA